jgi:signal recognition particle receptor subunit beta
MTFGQIQGNTMHINWQLRELNLKIVYYGPALSGKTTNLEQIHANVDPQRRSDLVSLKTSEDRTLFFDFLQLELGMVCTLTPKIHLYTVPGQTYYEASRRLVLRGTDGIVFVADSSAARVNDNLQSWEKMKEHLDSFKMSMVGLPTVLQCNKQDLPDAITAPALQEIMQVNGCPFYESVAIEGKGVFETLKAITRLVVEDVQSEVA